MKPIEKTIETVWERKRSYEASRMAQRKRMIRSLAVASCLCLLLSAVIGGALLPKVSATEDYRILLDINPSIEISVDENNRVKEIDGLNTDGQKILEGKDPEGKPVPDALKEIISEVVDQGYISEEANSVLVSVEGAEAEKSQAIKEELVGSINEALKESNLEGAVIIQGIPAQDENLKTECEVHGISAGKAYLIHQILEQNKFRSFDELSKMSIHELNLLRISYYIDIENSLESGVPTESAYIGSDRAKEIALGDANVSTELCTARLECQNAVMIYCAEFETETDQYRYRINAATGEILSSEKIALGDESFFVGDKEIAEVGEDAALLAALSHAGMENSTLIRTKYNRDWVEGIVVCNLFFTDGIRSGRYILDARTGEILQYSVTEEYRDRSVKESVIGDLEAKRLILSKDGLIDGNVSKYEMNLKSDGDTLVYKFTLLCNGFQYEAQVKAADGSILSFAKTDLKDTGSPSVETGSASSAEG